MSAAPRGERRRRRSEDTITALHYQLAHARSGASLDALVLVDELGCLVAGAGAWPACEELAAYAPLLASPGDVNETVSSRVAELTEDVVVQPIHLVGGEVLLCGRGPGGARSAWMARAADGCRRILG